MIDIQGFSNFFVANWKLNGNKTFIEEYFQKLTVNPSNCIVICSPYIYLNQISSHEKNFYLGAQDVSQYKDGPYTGEVSSNMLKDNNIDFCIVGHSERRQLFNETNDVTNIKSSNLINSGVIPIICIGETLDEKEKGITKDILKNQIFRSIPNNANHNNTIIAYEPIWAIGTGLRPTLEDINEVHNFIRSIKTDFQKYKILYGGSVKSTNSNDIIELDNVDGCLIGGASVNVEEFNIIIS